MGAALLQPHLSIRLYPPLETTYATFATFQWLFKLNFLKSQIVRFLENADLKFGGSKRGEDFRVALDGGRGVGACVPGGWPGACCWV